MKYIVCFQPDNISLEVSGGTVLQAMITAGLHPDAPCGGMGTCGKCIVSVNGKQVLACRTAVTENMTVVTKQEHDIRILTHGSSVSAVPDRAHRYAIAFDIGTTTVVAFLMNGLSGELLAQKSCKNPQAQYGADVISRIRHALREPDALQTCIRETLHTLTEEVSREAGIGTYEISAACIVCNTAMHHLLLGIDPRPLVTPPYMPRITEALVIPADGLLPVSGQVRILPNIAGFVGGDTVGCMVATRFDQVSKITLLIDIGTNGEMVLGDGRRQIACSTAAGPAFEGASISCGMQGTTGAVDRVWLEAGQVQYHVIGDEKALGLCGSGLLDLIAVLLDLGMITESGAMSAPEYRLADTSVVLTRRDIREVQLAKAAIGAGIRLLSEKMGISVSDIEQVFLAGAFGNYLNPASACRIGMIPPVLEDRILPIGNAAGAGAKLCALNQAEFEYSKVLSSKTEFLELASLPQFQDCYVAALDFSGEVFQ